ncbi:MAG: hypothetical protein R3Y63_15465 [Eubacteriales bacterium]
MKIIITVADETKIQQLEQESTFTWEGMELGEGDTDAMAEDFLHENLVREDTEEMVCYQWNGKTMNSLYHLQGDNKYPEDFSFIAFDNKAFNGSANLKAFKLCVGARWLDDIVSNNTINDR